MTLWSVCFVFGLLGVKGLAPDIATFMGEPSDMAELQRLEWLLLELSEALQCGLLPDINKWQELNSSSAPGRLGKILGDLVADLRASGAQVVPTLQRFQAMLVFMRESQQECRNKGAQAQFQALFCLFIVPCVGVLLYWLLPGLPESAVLWWVATLIAFGLSLSGYFWMKNLIEHTQRGGVSPHWIPLVQLTGESFLARLRSGLPPDLAWGEACSYLLKDKGEDVFHALSPALSGFEQKLIHKPIHKLTQSFGRAITRAVHASQMEGVSCSASVEGAIASFCSEYRAYMARQFQLLPGKMLKPLFLVIAPAVIGLISVGFFLTMAFVAGGIE